MTLIESIWTTFRTWPYSVLFCPIVFLCVYAFLCILKKYKFTEEAIVEIAAYGSAVSWSMGMVKAVFQMTKEEERVIITTLIGAIVLGFVALKGIYRTLQRFQTVEAQQAANDGTQSPEDDG